MPRYFRSLTPTPTTAMRLRDTERRTGSLLYSVRVVSPPMPKSTASSATSRGSRAAIRLSPSYAKLADRADVHLLSSLGYRLPPYGPQAGAPRLKDDGVTRIG